MITVLIGHCRDCAWRDSAGECINNDKIHEDDFEARSETSDHLIYSYDESGGFWVGQNFGCIHWKPKS